MRPIHLSLRDFKSHASTDVDLAGVHVAAISGTNGAGKSTLLDAIVYALFGADGLGLAKQSDSVIREGADAATVTLVFDAAGGRYRVTRTRKITGKTTLELARRERTGDGRYPESWNALTRGTVKETQAAIVDAVGATADTYLRTVHVGQGDAARFTNATAAERKATLAEALDLGQYPPLAQAARDRGRADQLAHDTAAQRVTDLATQLDAVGVDTLQVRVLGNQKIRTELETRRPELARQVESARKAVEEARVAAASSDAARQRVTDLEQHVARLDADRSAAEHTYGNAVAAARSNREVAAQLDELVAAQPVLVDVAPLEQAAEEAAQALDRTRSERERVRVHGDRVTASHRAVDDLLAVERRLNEDANVTGRKLDAFRSQEAPTCPTCRQDVVGEAHQRTLDQLTKDHEAAEAAHQQAITNRLEGERAHEELVSSWTGPILSEVQEAESAAQNAAAAAKMRVDAARRSNEQHHAMAARVATARQAAERQPQLDADETAASERVQQARTTHDTAVADLARARENLAGDDTAQRITQLERERETAIAALEQADREYQQFGESIARDEADLARAEQLQQQLDDARATLAPLAAARERWDVLTRAFGRDGIPAQVIRHARPQIEQDANSILNKVGAPYRIRLDLERDTKAGTVQDTLDVTILAGGHERPLELLSGGERYRVAVALRVAIGRVLANRSGRRIETLVLDEPEGLDTAGFSALADLIRGLGQEFGLVLTVSHTDGLEAACDTAIRVTRDDAGASRVEVAA